jgi:uncharacterized protein YceK
MKNKKDTVSRVIKNMMITTVFGILLSGCASVKAAFESPSQQMANAKAVRVAQQAQMNAKCDSAPILYSNLKLPVQKRIYFLMTGDKCYAHMG